MKIKILFLSMFFLSTGISIGQAPLGFKYQAVVRNASGQILLNQAVGLRIKIIQGALPGTTAYTETFAASTDAFGTVSINIGSGTTTDSFGGIDWSNGPFFIETAADVTGGTNYLILGTSQLLSVPFSLYASTAGSAMNDNVNDNDHDSTNEMNMSLSLSGNSLQITDAKGTLSADLSPLTSGKWNVSGSDISNPNSGYVGINTTSPDGPFDVEIQALNNPVKDQEQSSYWSGQTLSDEWQSFTAGASGFFSKIDVFNANAATPLSFTLRIYDSIGTSGTLLSTHDLKMTSGTGWKSLILGVKPAILQSGKTYTMRFTGGARLGKINADNYSGGRASWSATEDLQFVTYVSTTSKMQGLLIDEFGNVGIGTNMPTSKVQIVGLPVFSNNAAAVSGGLTPGALFRTGGDPDIICVVH